MRAEILLCVYCPCLCLLERPDVDQNGGDTELASLLNPYSFVSTFDKADQIAFACVYKLYHFASWLLQQHLLNINRTNRSMGAFDNLRGDQIDHGREYRAPSSPHLLRTPSPLDLRRSYLSASSSFHPPHIPSLFFTSLVISRIPTRLFACTTPVLCYIR